MNWFPPFNYILASKSPRRIEILSGLGLPFSVQPSEAAETFPGDLDGAEIPVYLAEQKATCFEDSLQPGDLLITADTIVWLEGEVLGKPVNAEEARYMLRRLSGRRHQVITGVCLKSVSKARTFHVVTHVSFRDLSDQEIDFYIENFKPFDKAGAYGIQEWIGMTGITGIEGCYYNVVGLPVQKLYEEILSF